MNCNQAHRQHQADVGVARVHSYAYPCATTRGSWFAIGMHTGLKPRPRRSLRIS
jgi:hypothetical protein